MKRALLLAFFVAVVGAAAYWIQGRHGGDLHAAWADAAQRLGIETAAATRGSEARNQSGPPATRREAPRIAEDLGVSPGAVRTIRHRAMTRLRDCVLGGARP